MIQPARSIVEMLGGVGVVAKALHLTPSAVSKWSTPTERGGCGGLIPSRHIPPLCRFAPTRDCFLEPNTFFWGHI